MAEKLMIGRDAFTDVFDLLHIHRERQGGGNHTRAVLNPLAVLLAHSTWERLLKSLVEEVPSHRMGEVVQPYRLLRRKRKGSGYDIGGAAVILSELTNDKLPRAFEIDDFSSARGRRLTGRRRVTGADFDPDRLRSSPKFDALGQRLNEYIALRNGVAHRAVGEEMGAAEMRSDAADGNSINASVAGIVVAFYLQLVDQTINALLESPISSSLTVSDRKAVQLPVHWLRDQGGGTRARYFRAGELWGGPLR